MSERDTTGARKKTNIGSKRYLSMERHGQAGLSQPILIITRGSSSVYSSIAKAAEATGICRNRLAKALQRSDGYVVNSDPPVYVDIPIDKPS